MSDWSTSELCDAHPDIRVLTSQLLDFGGRSRFAGPALVVRCHGRGGPDGSLVQEVCSTRGEGRVLVVDAAGIRSQAVVGEQAAAEAAGNGWAGLLVHGVVRDVGVLRSLDLGVKALGSSPRGSTRRGVGARDLTAEFGSVVFTTGDHVYADETGVVASTTALDLTRGG